MTKQEENLIKKLSVGLSGKKPIVRESEILRKYGWIVTKEFEGGNGTTSGNYGVIFIAPFACEVRKVLVSWETASSSGTLQVERLQGTTAGGSGDDILSSAIDTSGTADTVNTVNTPDLTSARILDQGDRLGLVPGGTLTSLTDLSITVYLIVGNNGDYR